MSLEISWYLRFSRSEQIEFMLRPSGHVYAEHALTIEPQWELAFSEEGESLIARFTRKTKARQYEGVTE